MTLCHLARSNLPSWPSATDAGVVDQYVEPAEVVDRRGTTAASQSSGWVTSRWT